LGLEKLGIWVWKKFASGLSAFTLQKGQSSSPVKKIKLIRQTVKAVRGILSRFRFTVKLWVKFIYIVRYNQ